MILSDRDIFEAIRANEINVVPLDDNDVQPASVDIHISNILKWADPSRNLVMDPENPNEITWSEVQLDDGEIFLLHPGTLVLVGSLERIYVGPKFSAHVDGVSSLGRIGLIIHSGSPYIDPGFNGHLTLELGVTSQVPVALRAGMRIGQVVFHQLITETLNPYGVKRGSRYQGQVEPTPMRSHKE